MSKYNIKFQWDSDAAVWIATSEDVPGLVLESDSLDALMERVKLTVPELLVSQSAMMPAQCAGIIAV